MSLSIKNKYIKRFAIVVFILIAVLVLYKYKLLPFMEPFQSTPSFVDVIDRFVYINLENRPDRKKLIVPELNRMGVPDEKIQRVAGVYIPKNGHKGCIQSHILALRLALLNNWSTVAIFEDDAVMMEKLSVAELTEKINGALAELPPDWDVLMLATANKKNTELPEKKYINILNFATTSSAYIINSKYYDKLIRLFEYCNSMMTDKQWGKDNGHEPFALDQKWAELQGNDNWFCMKEDLITQRNSASTINSKGEKINVQE